jgi:putative tricarboxylic transport membrane protein
METTQFQKRKAYLLLGGGGMIFTACYLGMSFRLPFGEIDEPGAAIFPVAVGFLLMLGSVATLWEGWKMDSAEHVDLPAGTGRRRLLRLIGLLLGYFCALPWLGQIISSSLFCMLLMRVLSDISWPRVIAYSLATSIGLYAVFVYLLKVPMPRGVPGF